MTYQTITAPSGFATSLRAIAHSISGFFKSVGLAMIANSSAQHRLDRAQFLQAKSDEELAALNIKREDIVYMVFKDLHYM